MRILGLDYGSKTVGVAVSDPLGLTAQRLDTIWRKQENKLRQTLARIKELVDEYRIEQIVLGYPKNMNNTVGERAEKALEFKEMLEKRTGLTVIMWDERLTTVEADRTLMEAGVRERTASSIWMVLQQCLFYRDIWIPWGTYQTYKEETKITWKKSDFSLRRGQ